MGTEPTTWEVTLKEPISACFTLVQMPGRDAHVGGNLISNEDGIETKQTWSFAVGPMEDAESPLQWLQMALARACDGV